MFGSFPFENNRAHVDSRRNCHLKWPHYSAGLAWRVLHHHPWWSSFIKHVLPHLSRLRGVYELVRVTVQLWFRHTQSSSNCCFLLFIVQLQTSNAARLASTCNRATLALERVRPDWSGCAKANDASRSRNLVFQQQCCRGEAVDVIILFEKK